MAWEWELTLDTDKVKADVRDGAAAGLKAAVGHVLTVALRHVPRESGNLAKTGRATVDTERLRGCVSFDGPYAVKQHEDLQLQHDAGQTAKYLENAFNSEKRTVQQIIAGDVRDALEE